MKKVIVSLIIGFMICLNVVPVTVMAVTANEVQTESIMIASGKEEPKYNSGSSTSKDFWGNATKWFKEGNISNEEKYGVEMIETLEDMILVVGTTVIALATIVLGIKFMFGSVESKVDAKEGLFNLLVACLFFFGWNSIKNLLFPGNKFIFLNDSDTSYTQPVARIFNISTYVLQFLAVVAIIYVGVRYVFSGVQGKTDLKEKSGMFIVGIILAFCSTGFLTWISDIINEALAKS